ncbi:MAG TPA: methyltransferase domain-containing protein [Methylibium sp.]|uniref:methyltransferase domain-containing protein n=1 Tax=Methylibium sp. TaxID=2067992 RepID=UPI002DBB69F8|nr:methyltransferase domain-containing protein [Methylibium sp.]HEU4457957.1 methyltransferase domain-containing protein [Methylibium sp.]
MHDSLPNPSDPSPPQPAAVAALLRRAARAGEAPWLHREIARRMTERLGWIKRRPARVLDWWSVQGGSLAALREALPRSRIDAVEPSAALRDAARAMRRSPWWSMRRWTQEAGDAWLEGEAPADGAAQLLWSNMALHWAPDPAALFARWRRALAVDGFVMFSCFGPDTLRELRTLHRHRGWGASGHGFIDMHDLGDMLVAAGFADPVMDMEALQLHWADAASMLAELRTLGGNAAATRFAGLRTPRWRRGFVEATAATLAGADGRPALGFEIVYGHAFVPAARLKVEPEVRVSADALRRMARAGASGSALP